MAAAPTMSTRRTRTTISWPCRIVSRPPSNALPQAPALSNAQPNVAAGGFRPTAPALFRSPRFHARRSGTQPRTGKSAGQERNQDRHARPSGRGDRRFGQQGERQQDHGRPRFRDQQPRFAAGPGAAGTAARRFRADQSRPAGLHHRADAPFGGALRRAGTRRRATPIRRNKLSSPRRRRNFPADRATEVREPVSSAPAPPPPAAHGQWRRRADAPPSPKPIRRNKAETA